MSDDSSTHDDGREVRSSAYEALQYFGIHNGVRTGVLGVWQNTTCPRCSHTRQAEHKKAKCLGVIVEPYLVTVKCNNCTWLETCLVRSNGSNGANRYTECTFHEYIDEDCVVLMRKVRNPKGVEPKCYWQRPDGKGGWVKGLKGLTKRAKEMLYRLPEVLEAIANGRTIVVAEGESDVDKLWDLGIPATCSPHGAAATRDKDGHPIQYKPKWYRAHSEQLEGADIVVLNDNDEPGEKHADVTCRCSLGVAKSVRRLDMRTIWPDAPHNADVKDWLIKAGGTRERLDELMASAPLYGGDDIEEPTEPPPEREDFYAYLPQHNYIYMPTRELWPGSSVDTKIGEGTAEWLDQNRAVVQMIWAPGMPTIISNKVVDDGGWIDKPGDKIFNLYRPPTLPLGDKNRAAPWIEHVRKVYASEADHIIRYFAHRVQRPHEKINHGIILGGAPQTGKDTLLEPVRRAVGPWNFAEVSPQQVLGRFNSFVKSVILRVSEARDLGELNRFALYEHMKTYLAAPPDTLRCDEKNIKEHAVFNVMGVIVTSNRKDSFFLPEDDRRHLVAWTELTRDDFTEAYWKELWTWYENGGYSHVAAYLSTFDISDFNAKAPPPKTAAFWDIVEANRNPEDSELRDIIEKLGNPDALTLSMIRAECSDLEFSKWLEDRRNSKQVHHRLGDCGYVPVREPHCKDGLWVLGGKRHMIYAKADLSVHDRHVAAKELKDDPPKKKRWDTLKMAWTEEPWW